MSFIKITVCICLQNFRKWQKDYRIWTIAAILFILILENTRKFSDLSADLGVSSKSALKSENLYGSIRFCIRNII